MELPAYLCEGRYTLVETLGSGGMATVLRAYDHRLKVWRAVKLLSAELVRKKKLRARFDAEAQAMALLEHPNIVRVYDVGVEGDQPYIVMELCEGGSPIDWLDQHGAMPPRLAVQVALQLCAGIAAAHAAGVIHRDIKPHNLLVTARGLVKVTDFGIARIDDSDVQSALTKTGSMMGTLGFMAPEQRVDAKSVDARADVYAIGATLYTLLTGRTNMDLFAADAEDEVMADVHPALRPIVLQATQYKREQRPEGAAALIASLEAAFPELPRDPASTPPLAMPAGAAPPIPQLPTLAPLPTAQPTLAVEEAPQAGRARLRPRTPTPAPAASRSLANLPFPKAEPRRTPARSDGPVAAEEAPIAARAAQMQASGDAQPDYQVSAPESARAEPYTITLAQGEQVRAEGAPGEEEEEEGDGERLAVGGDDAKGLLQFVLQVVLTILDGLAHPAKLMAGPFALMGTIGVVVMFVGATNVNRAQTYAMQAEVAYEAALEQDLAALTERVIEAGGSEVALRPLMDAYTGARTKEAEIEAAAKLLDALREQASIARVTAEINRLGTRGDVDQAMMRLTAAQRERDSAHAAWAAAASSARGGWAVGCGAAEAP